MGNTTNTTNTRTPMKSYEQESLVNLYGMMLMLEKYIQSYKRIADRVDNGWRDLRLIQSNLERLVTRLMDTVPVKQLQRLERQMEISEIRVVVHDVSGKRQDYWLMDRDDLVYLVNAAVEGACLMCEDQNGYGCRLKKLLEELPVTCDGSGSSVVVCKHGL